MGDDAVQPAVISCSAAGFPMDWQAVGAVDGRSPGEHGPNERQPPGYAWGYAYCKKLPAIWHVISFLPIAAAIDGSKKAGREKAGSLGQPAAFHADDQPDHFCRQLRKLFDLQRAVRRGRIDRLPVLAESLSGAVGAYSRAHHADVRNGRCPEKSLRNRRTADRNGKWPFASESERRPHRVSERNLRV
ncbi:hypothetical protein D3C80_1421790 [compost metagenome]